MKKFFIVYGHYDDKSFNAAIKKKFIAGALEAGHKVDLLDLYKENFNPIFAGEEPGSEILDHRKRIEDCDAIVFIAPVWNFRMPAILEGWIDQSFSTTLGIQFQTINWKLWISKWKFK